MNEVLVLVLKALAGGACVVAFSLLAERLRPQSFAGLLAAAPAVALASLGVIAVSKGAREMVDAAAGMIVGAAAMALAALVAIDSVRRFGALRGALVSVAAWVAAAGALFGVTLR